MYIAVVATPKKTLYTRIIRFLLRRLISNMTFVGPFNQLGEAIHWTENKRVDKHSYIIWTRPLRD